MNKDMQILMNLLPDNIECNIESDLIREFKFMSQKEIDNYEKTLNEDAEGLSTWDNFRMFYTFKAKLGG